MPPSCYKCGKTVMETNLYRNAPYGEMANWACLEHVDPKYAPSPEDIEEVKRIQRQEFKASDRIIGEF